VEGITYAHCKTMHAGAVFLQFHVGGRILLLHTSDTAAPISNTDIYWVEKWLPFIHTVVLCLTFLIFWWNVNFIMKGIIHVVHMSHCTMPQEMIPAVTFPIFWHLLQA